MKFGQTLKVVKSSRVIDCDKNRREIVVGYFPLRSIAQNLPKPCQMKSDSDKDSISGNEAILTSLERYATSGTLCSSIFLRS